MPQGFMQICQNPDCGNSFWSESLQLLCDACRIPPDIFDEQPIPSSEQSYRQALDAEFWNAYFARHPEEQQCLARRS